MSEIYPNAQPQTKRGTERCLAFLEAATFLFLQNGYDAVSLDDIVHYAGGSKASLYKFFGSKEGLFKAICDYRREIFLKELYNGYICQSNNIKQQLITILKNFYQHITHPENVKFLRLILERAKYDPHLAQHIYEQGPEKVLDNLAKQLEKAHQLNIIYCTHSLNSAKLFVGSVWHYEWQALMGISALASETEIEEYIQYSVDYFLKAHNYCYL